MDSALKTHSMRAVFLPPDIVAALPTAAIVSSMTSRLRAEDALDIRQTLRVEIIGETPSTFALQVHRGVCRFIDGDPAAADFSLRMDRGTLDAIVIGKDTYTSAVNTGRATLTGDVDAFAGFMGLFEDPWEIKPPLTLR